MDQVIADSLGESFFSSVNPGFADGEGLFFEYAF
jgi:hypothetical protein